MSCDDRQTKVILRSKQYEVEKYKISTNVQMGRNAAIAVCFADRQSQRLKCRRFHPNITDHMYTGKCDTEKDATSTKKLVLFFINTYVAR